VGGGPSWTAVTAGGYHSCGIQVDGSLWCWGKNDFGQLGDGTASDQKDPILISAAEGGWLSVSAGGDHTCGVQSDGSLWCWGLNDNGQLGDGSFTDRNVPTRVGGEYRWSLVTAGEDFSCAFKTDGNLWCWGWNFFGQVGDGSTSNRNVPIQVAD